MGDSTGTYTFCALVCAPVPVGHRVEVSWLDQEGGGFFGSPSKRLAHVVDLDTGVTYMTDEGSFVERPAYQRA